MAPAHACSRCDNVLLNETYSGPYVQLSLAVRCAFDMPQRQLRRHMPIVGEDAEC